MLSSQNDITKLFAASGARDTSQPPQTLASPRSLERFRIEHRLTAEWRTVHSGPSQLWGGTKLTQSTSAIYIPFWFLTTITGTLFVVAVGIPSKRFSLRTLLIATTLVRHPSISECAPSSLSWSLRQV